MLYEKSTWWDEAWNPVWGCTPVSEECEHCYAKSLVETRFANNPLAPVHDFNVKIVEKQFNKRFKKSSKRIFICNMSDLFHEQVPFEVVDRVLARVAQDQERQYFILTKREKRMAEYFSYHDTCLRVANEAKIRPHKLLERWPLKNLWLGVTAGNQKNLDLRVPYLLKTGWSNLFVSIEPMLEDANLKYEWFETDNEKECPNKNLTLHRKIHLCPKCAPKTSGGIGWIIFGAESGSDRRRCENQWITNGVKMCKSANIPVFVKQLDINGKLVKDIYKFPELLRIREFPEMS
jgi:protein gp37